MGRLVRSAVVALARRRPRLLYGAAGAAGWLLGPSPRSVATTRLIRTAFPALGLREAARVRRRLAASELKSRVLGSVLAGTDVPVYPDVRRPAAHAGPAVVVTFHMGPLGAVGDVLGRLEGEVGVFQVMNWAVPPSLVVLTPLGAVKVGAAPLGRAVAILRRGGHVFFTLDRPKAHEPTIVAGRARLRRAPFALARLTGAPIVPLLARWDGTVVEILRAETIPAGDDEAAMAAAVAAALERFLRDDPAAAGAQGLGMLTRERPPAPRPPS